MSTLAVDAIVDSSNGNTTTINGATPTAYNTMCKNRIINGAMEIDQRNAGASTAVSSTTQYMLDRWRAIEITDGGFSVERSTTAPAGYTNSMKFTITSADTSLAAGQLSGFDQFIEGYNAADLGFGTANAKTVTLSFWVRSSLTGTFSGALRNSATNRTYIFTYAISAADTWEYKTITVAGDTSGTWLTDNGIGINVIWSFGTGTDWQGTAGSWSASGAFSTSGSVSLIGTNGATFYITGVQLEVGSVATEFERRLYGTELQLCQRYYYQMNCYGTGSDNFYGRFVGIAETGTNVIFSMFWPSGEMRTTPTASYSGSLRMDDYYSANNPAGTFTSGNLTKWGGILQVSVASGSFTQGRTIRLLMNSSVGSLNFSAEL